MAEPTTYTATVIARLLGLTVTRVGQLAQMGVIPRDEHNRYPLAGVVRGYVDFLRANREGPSEEVARSKGRLLAARARSAESEADLLEGRALDRDDVERAWGRVLDVLRTRVLAVPAAAAGPAFAAASLAEVNAIITAAVTNALDDASRTPVYHAPPRSIAAARGADEAELLETEASEEADGLGMG